jgi:hypothetical protein
LTRGVQANRVNGELAPRQAIDLLLANTGLVAVHHPKTGHIRSGKRHLKNQKTANGRRY